MRITIESRKAKMRELARIGGHASEHAMLEAAAADSVVLGICMNEGCSYTAEVEPDQEEGACEECQESTVQSPLIVLGLI